LYEDWATNHDLIEMIQQKRCLNSGIQPKTTNFGTFSRSLRYLACLSCDDLKKHLSMANAHSKISRRAEMLKFTTAISSLITIIGLGTMNLMPVTAQESPRSRDDSPVYLHHGDGSVTRVFLSDSDDSGPTYIQRDGTRGFDIQCPGCEFTPMTEEESRQDALNYRSHARTSIILDVEPSVNDEKISPNQGNPVEW
jgi:hypothetical protein